ncbi:MAG: hypothetical protein JXA24_01430 [Proteobacteria bacterium]|nr:hypothetical protein [Pseudomonadota bacterium]
MRHITHILSFLSILALTAACGNSVLTAQGNPDASASAYRSFALAGDFPADLAIPDIEGMRGTAFVVSASDPAGVIAVDIDSDPMRLSQKFEGFLAASGSGIPAKLLITAIDRAYLLTSNAVILFDPRTGTMLDFTSAVAAIDIGAGLLNSDGSAAQPALIPSYPGGIAVNGDRLFVSSANYIRTQAPAVTAPGTIQVFRINGDGSTDRTGHVVTTGFNPTGLAVRGDELVVVNSGVIDIIDSRGVAQTDASIDVVDVESLGIEATIPIGPVAASYHPPAITKDGSRAFIGSAAQGEIYEIDLINRQALRGIDDPIAVSAGQDFVSSAALAVDDGYLYASSFELSAAFPVELAEGGPIVEDPFVVGFPAGVTDENPSGANTGAGPLAVRPGSRGVDYKGEDLYVLTGYPGSIVAIDTGAPAQAFVAPSEEEIPDDTPVPNPPAGSDGDACRGFAQGVKSVSYGPGAGFGQSSMPTVVLGPPRGAGELSGSLHVLSLGNGGSIAIDLGNCPAIDGPGDDFIVFENAFFIGGNPAAPYAELGIVSASADGVNFLTFPCSLGSYPYHGCAGWNPVYSHPDNGIDPFDPSVAGGEAYDLADVGLAMAKYIMITDAGMAGGSGTTAGFDLDAISVVNGEIDN